MSNSPWINYSGTAETVLVVILVAAAGALAYAGIRLRRPVRPPRPGRAAKIALLGIWVLAIAALLASVSAYLVRVGQAGLSHAPRPDPITPVTLIGVVVVFFAIAFAQRGRGWGVAAGSAVVGAMAAPMIFELPFDLIIMPRSHPVIDPGFYRLLLFGTLILVDITTMALLWLSPAMRLQPVTLWCLAGMLAVFAVWGLFGFSYPSAPGPITLNVVSKILSLVTALSLFRPERVQSEKSQRAQAAAAISA